MVGEGWADQVPLVPRALSFGLRRNLKNQAIRPDSQRTSLEGKNFQPGQREVFHIFCARPAQEFPMKKLFAVMAVVVLYAAVANFLGAAASSAQNNAARQREAQIEAATK